MQIYSKKEAIDAIFYSYTRCINGFAATLEEEHAAALSGYLLCIKPSSTSFSLNEWANLQIHGILTC